MCPASSCWQIFSHGKVRDSLADRVCFALARSLSSPAYTADRVWEQWADELGVEVRVIR